MPQGKPFITEAYLLKELLKVSDDGTYRIDLPPSLIARNKYLFNDDKSQLDWLLENDAPFMQMLVTHFGYTQDKKLLHWAMKNTLDPKNQRGVSVHDITSVFYRKTCNDQVIIHQETLDIIKRELNKGNELYADALEEFHRQLVDTHGNLSFAQKAKLLAYFGYWGETLGSQKYEYHFFVHLQAEAAQYEKEFKKRNYYNLPNFKQLWDETKNGGIALPGQLE